MKLTTIEKDEVVHLIETYKTIHDEIKTIENSITEFEEGLKSLYSKKDLIIKQLEDSRDSEIQMVNNLANTYGDGKLDINNFEWINTQKQTDEQI